MEKQNTRSLKQVFGIALLAACTLASAAEPAKAKAPKTAPVKTQMIKSNDPDDLLFQKYFDQLSRQGIAAIPSSEGDPDLGDKMNFCAANAIVNVQRQMESLIERNIAKNPSSDEVKKIAKDIRAAMPIQALAIMMSCNNQAKDFPYVLPHLQVTR